MYKVTADHRASLYYNQYEWCVTVTLNEANCLRYLETKRFEQAIVNTKLWHSQKSYYSPEPFIEWNSAIELDLRAVRDCLLAETHAFKTQVWHNTLHVYTNHPGLADKLRCDGLGLRLVRQAVISRPTGVVQLRESPYAYRTYFRERKYTRDQKDLLLGFMHARKHTLHPCDSLMRWLSREALGYVLNRSYSRSYYFVDHDHPNEATMISLVVPGIVRKTLPIQTAK